MIITRTPVRISLGGGGTDLPSYYERFGGMVVSAAINRYIYITLNRTFTPGYFVKYSAIERADRIRDIEHPIVREALAAHKTEPAIELVSVADIPSGTGLGSSGAFTVGLLRALHSYQRNHVTVTDLADEACRLEIDVLGRAVGKQDQYIAAFGGLTCFDFKPDGSVDASPLKVVDNTMHELEEHLLMFFTGYSRDAETVLEEQKVRSEQDDEEMIENLHYMKSIGLSIKDSLERGDTQAFAASMNEHWEHKKKRSKSMSNGEIDRLYDIAMENGALGGKLVGAGAGGFLLFYANDQDRLRRAMSDQHLTEVRFVFDHDGSIVLVRD
jgi:D-glycero-alpha-D-manno-heptose-7-phosphate kinase